MHSVHVRSKATSIIYSITKHRNLTIHFLSQNTVDSHIKKKNKTFFDLTAKKRKRQNSIQTESMTYLACQYSARQLKNPTAQKSLFYYFFHQIHRTNV